MNNSIKEPSLSTKLMRRYVSAPPEKAAMYAGGMFGILMFVYFIVRDAISGDLSQRWWIDIVFNAGVWIIAAWFFGLLMKPSIIKQRRKLDEALGVELTDEERGELFWWSKTGKKPHALRLQSVLDTYLTFIEKNLRGRFDMPMWQRWYGIVFFVVVGLGNVLLVVTTASIVAKIWHLVLFVLSGILATIYLPLKPGQSNHVYEVLNGRQLRRLERLRRQS